MKGIEREVAILGDLSYPDMAMRWEVVHGAPPPKGMSGRLLLRRSPIGFRWTPMAPLIPKLAAICAQSRRVARKLFVRCLP